MDYSENYFSLSQYIINNSFQQIVMFSIGSGIAALYPIAKAIVDDETELTRVHLIAGFRSVIHVPLKKELTYLADYWNFKCTLQLSRLNGTQHWDTTDQIKVVYIECSTIIAL